MGNKNLPQKDLKKLEEFKSFKDFLIQIENLNKILEFNHNFHLKKNIFYLK